MHATTSIRLDDGTRDKARAIARLYGLTGVSDGIRLAVADTHRRAVAPGVTGVAESDRVLLARLVDDLAELLRRLDNTNGGDT